MTPSTAISEQTITQLITAAQAGDTRAFEQLLHHYYDFIFRVAYKWCGKREDAQDITQHTCLKLASVIGHYRFESQFSTWLYRVVLNVAKDYHKHLQRHRSREQSDIDLSLFASDAPNAEESLMARHLYWCISKLPEKLRLAVLLVAAEGLSHAEAGEALDCKEGTISWRISEARKQLSACLYEKGAAV